MTTKCVALLRQDEVLVSYNYFNLPELGEKDFYIATKSFTAFSYREKIRYYNWTKSKRRKPGDVYPNKSCIVEFVVDAFRWAEPEPTVPAVYHETIWDLYKAIDYDYKFKRFNKDTK